MTKKPDNNFWDGSSPKKRGNPYLKTALFVILVLLVSIGSQYYIDNLSNKSSSPKVTSVANSVKNNSIIESTGSDTNELPEKSVIADTDIPKNNISSNQNNIQTPTESPSQIYAPTSQPTQPSEHFVNFNYRNYTCYGAGNKSYEVVDYLIGDSGSTWYVSDNVDTTLCSGGEYLLFSISRSPLVGSKSIFFKPFDKYPPDYADDSDGDQISIKYDLNRNRIESISYFGY